MISNNLNSNANKYEDFNSLVSGFDRFMESWNLMEDEIFLISENDTNNKLETIISVQRLGLHDSIEFKTDDFSLFRNINKTIEEKSQKSSIQSDQQKQQKRQQHDVDYRKSLYNNRSRIIMTPNTCPMKIRKSEILNEDIIIESLKINSTVNNIMEFSTNRTQSKIRTKTRLPKCIVDDITVPTSMTKPSANSLPTVANARRRKMNNSRTSVSDNPNKHIITPKWKQRSKSVNEYPCKVSMEDTKSSYVSIAEFLQEGREKRRRKIHEPSPDRDAKKISKEKFEEKLTAIFKKTLKTMPSC